MPKKLNAGSTAFFLLLLAGIGWRIAFSQYYHPASQFIYSDMNMYASRAVRYCESRAPENISDTLFPPGTHAFFGALYCFQRNWTFAEYGLLFLSVASLGAVWILARLTGTKNAARLAVVFAALYSPFVDFSGYFLAEALLLPLLTLASAFFYYALFWHAPGGAQPAKHRRTAALVASGFLFALSAFVKTQGFATFVLTAAVCFFSTSGFANRARRAFVFVFPAALLFALSAERCTRLSEGRFCLIANNAGYNMLLGHSPGIRKIRFVDYKRHHNYYFASPTTLWLGYKDEIMVPIPAYESGALEQLAWQQFELNPQGVVEMTWLQLQALFGKDPLWPITDWSAEWYARLGNSFWWLIVLPPLFILAAVRHREVLRLPWNPLFWLSAAPITALVVCSVLGVGEPRYRIPFDGYFLIMAAHAWIALLSREQPQIRPAGAEPFVPAAEENVSGA